MTDLPEETKLMKMKKFMKKVKRFLFTLQIRSRLILYIISIGCAVMGIYMFIFMMKHGYPGEKLDTFTRLILSGFGLLVSAVGLCWSLRAAVKSQDVIDTFVNMVSSFNGLASKVNDKFVCFPKAGTMESKIHLQLLSPAFGGLNKKKSRLFDIFNRRLNEIPNRTSLKILCLDEEKLVIWYSDMIRLLVKGMLQEEKRIEVIEEMIKTTLQQYCITKLEKIRLTIESRIGISDYSIGEREFRTTKYVPLQVFLREDDSRKRSLYGIMGSEFPTMALVAFERQNYEIISDFSRGFYSETPEAFEHYQDIFYQIWNHSEPRNAESLHDYFDYIINALKDIHSNWRVLLSPRATR